MLKGAASAVLFDEKRRAERSKHLIVLISQHLESLGYANTVDALKAESGVSPKQYEPADNVDLLNVLQEWEDYYELRFQKKPKLVRKISNYVDAVPPQAKSAAKRLADASNSNSRASSVKPNSKIDSSKATRPTSSTNLKPGLEAAASGVDAGQLHVSGLNATIHRQRYEAEEDEAPGPWENRIRKAGLPPALAANSELRELATYLQRDMVQTNPNVRWDTIAELHGVKRILKESLVMPLRYPHLFTGLVSPWKGVLLYGPPGTGKTLLAKAVATECNTVFFNISASSIVSKWRGDSEKLVRVLFDLARHHAPSTIFIDEIDSIMSARGEAAGEHEGSRRMKTELLVQMDGLLASDAQIFVLAATNLPWELDMALLRRLEKRIHVPLPDAKARSIILRCLLPTERADASLPFDDLAQQAEGYSGSDLTLVCKEAAMRPLRRLLSILEVEGGDIPADAKPDLVSSRDVNEALLCTRPTVHVHIDRYKKWEEEFGST